MENRSHKRVICFYSGATHLGGAERSLLELLKRMSSSRESAYLPWVLLPDSEGPLLGELSSAGIDYTVLQIPKSFYKMSRGAPLAAFQMGLRSIPGMGFYLSRLAILLKKKNPVLIHSNAIKCHALASIVGSATGIPVLWHLRDILQKGPTQWALASLCKGLKNHVVANSQATADSLIEAAPGMKSRTTVIHNGVDPQFYQPKRNRVFNALLDVPEATPVVGIVGALARWKGQLEFVRMASKLIERGSKARFVIIGAEIYDTLTDQGYAEELREEIKRLGIADQVVMTGFRDNPVETMNGLDILVHASIRPEPFGRVVLEAMACGTPVAAAAAGGILEIVEEGKTGLLFAPSDLEAMTNTVERLLGSEALRRELALQARESASQKFTLERHCMEMLALYGRILGKH